MRRLIVPLAFGLFGAAVLIGLGLWQMQRLAWKASVIADIDARLLDAPMALPAEPEPVRDRFLPVVVSGTLTSEDADVLVSRKLVGAGYRVIAAMRTDDGRRILIDRGFVTDDLRDGPRAARAVTVTGNLHWPDEVDGFTPPPDAVADLWFARDVAALSTALATEPVLVVARSDTGDGIEPLPVDTAGLPNDHLNYALTWFSLALVWLGMTGLWVWRITRRTA